MRNILKRTLGRGPEDQKGFTLIELLVVVGIIVALAAAIIPLVVQFSGKGEEGNWATEAATIQSAVDTMMTENTVSSITARSTAAVVAGTETLGIVGATTDLADYIRDLPTTCEYTWNTAGLVVQANAAGAVCDLS